jgi:hypothetical protein
MSLRRCRGQRAAGDWRGGGRVRPLLIWGALTLLAALALTIVLAGVDIEPFDPAPPSTPPMWFESPMVPRPQ